MVQKGGGRSIEASQKATGKGNKVDVLKHDGGALRGVRHRYSNTSCPASLTPPSCRYLWRNQEGHTLYSTDQHDTVAKRGVSCCTCASRLRCQASQHVCPMSTRLRSTLGAGGPRVSQAVWRLLGCYRGRICPARHLSDSELLPGTSEMVMWAIYCTPYPVEYY